MTVFCENVYPWRRALRATFIMVLIGAWAVAAHAQVEGESTISPPYSLFQYSTITSSGNTIMATRVPVILAGRIVYEDVTLQFDVDSSGNLTLAPGYPQTGRSQNPLVSKFKAGKYVGPSTVFAGQAFIAVSGPGVESGGATEWSISTTSGTSPYTYPSSATWYVGPIAGSPFAGRIQKAGLSPTTQAAWSFGVGSGDGTTLDNGAWYWPCLLLGFSQIGNTITIISFTDDTGKDHNLPLGQITYTLAP